MRQILFTLLILPCLLLAGCATSSPDMMGTLRKEVEVEGINFVVFHDLNEAEVIRMGYLRRHERQGVPRLMAIAAEQASGCRVIVDSMTTRLPGDTGVARFDLGC
ncbi:hypothetical protein JJJ17_06315 [Paracoccus caeni]|uniref:Lipoprotein n=1 Tax=Paracoccus caeni TaxID=657651 RepID=A0A934VU83_9RHOB|nr:hypothetical protein [Paracoccus caeni]MBK4215536.1 hypothetical protein [Paracoccus caeni]